MRTRTRTTRGVLTALLLLVPAAVQPAGGEEHGYDSELAESVTRGDRLEVRNYAGRVGVRAGDGDEVRVRAGHAGRDRVLLRRRGAVIMVVPASWAEDAASFEVRPPDVGVVRVVGRAPGAVELDVTVPRWLPLLIEGPLIDVDVAGSGAPVEAMVMTGDIDVRGGRARVSLTTMSGAITLADADGRITIAGSNGRMTARRVGGDLRVETTTGDVTLEALTVDRLEVTTVGGDISHRGPLAAGCRWDVSTHSGDVSIALDAGADARLRLRALRGRIVTDLAPAGTDPHRLDLALGDGAADIRLMTFSGTIRLE